MTKSTYTGRKTRVSSEPVADMPSGIYRIYCTAESMAYIGSASNLIRRRQLDVTLLNRGMFSNKALQSAYNRYGIDRMIYEVLERCPKSELVQRRRVWIAKYAERGRCYNKNKNTI